MGSLLPDGVTAAGEVTAGGRGHCRRKGSLPPVGVTAGGRVTAVGVTGGGRGGTAVAAGGRRVEPGRLTDGPGPVAVDALRLRRPGPDPTHDQAATVRRGRRRDPEGSRPDDTAAAERRDENLSDRPAGHSATDRLQTGHRSWRRLSVLTYFSGSQHYAAGCSPSKKIYFTI